MAGMPEAYGSLLYEQSQSERLFSAYQETDCLQRH